MKYTKINYNFVLGYYVVPEPNKEVKTTIDTIKKIIQDESGIDNILKNSRKRSYVDARRIFYHILRNYHYLSLDKIGKLCGNRNHATILHSLRDVDFLIKSDPDIASLFNRVSDRVLNLKTEKQLLLEKIERLEKELLTLKKEKNGIYI
jgi:chromosomal replication initiation ATPase DnaA